VVSGNGAAVPPGRGGSNEAMKAIIEAHDRLREMLGIAV
jgi:hypothetical protein